MLRQVCKGCDIKSAQRLSVTRSRYDGNVFVKFTHLPGLPPATSYKVRPLVALRTANPNQSTPALDLTGRR